MFYWIAVLIIGGASLMILRINAWSWLVAITLWIIVGFQLVEIGLLAIILLVLLLFSPALIVAIKSLRICLLSKPILGIFKRILPRMSHTERIQLKQEPSGGVQSYFQENLTGTNYYHWQHPP